jgi:hypothetical protein
MFCLVYVEGVAFVSDSVVISSNGLGAGEVAIVQPIHVPMANMAMKVTKTGTTTKVDFRKKFLM